MSTRTTIERAEIVRKQRTKAQRQKIFDDHAGICCICFGEIAEGAAWEVHHMVELALGGEDGDDNLGPAHLPCHRRHSAERNKALGKVRRLAMANELHLEVLAKGKSARLTRRQSLARRMREKGKDGLLAERQDPEIED